jgi:hypothetical protein
MKSFTLAELVFDNRICKTDLINLAAPSANCLNVRRVLRKHLIACFDENVPETVIKEIAKRQPLRAVFRDNSFANSPSKINVGEIFKMMAPDTRVKVI